MYDHIFICSHNVNKKNKRKKITQTWGKRKLLELQRIDFQEIMKAKANCNRLGS